MKLRAYLLEDQRWNCVQRRSIAIDHKPTSAMSVRRATSPGQ
jgi:hypothetical protein